MRLLLKWINFISKEVENRTSPTPLLRHNVFDLAIGLWTQYLFSEEEAIKIKNNALTNYFYKLWDPIFEARMGTSRDAFGRTSRYYTTLGESILNFPDNDKKELSMSPLIIIVLLAFMAVAVSYLILRLQETTTKEEPWENKTDGLNSNQHNVPEPELPVIVKPASPIVEKVKKYSLIVAIPVNKANVIDSDSFSYEALYKATRFLSLVETEEVDNFSSKTNQVKAIDDSEYDVYLIKLDLNKYDHRFERDVDQVDRYDAFCDLRNLVTNTVISQRLTMDASSAFNLYSR
jgi:hypothetical protein